VALPVKEKKNWFLSLSIDSSHQEKGLYGY
jgi:hypothetical protein